MSGNHRSTRRDFLKGSAAREALALSLNPLAQDGSVGHSAEVSSLTALASFRRRAMACDFEVLLAAGRRDSSTEQVLAALDMLEMLEAQLTIYRSDSELISINRLAGQEVVAVEQRLFALLKLAKCVYQDTGGAFDPTSGPLSEVWGFSRRQGRMPGETEIAEARNRVGMCDVRLDEKNRTVSFGREGLSLHVNSIGKGYSLDRMAERLDAAGVDDYLIQGGRSSVLARGTLPGSERPGWTIGVPHPLRPGDRVDELRLVNQALGTSGSGTQYFEHEGRRYGHLLDPRTGRSVEDVYFATVVAASAAEADALSTAFYVMGPEETDGFCKKRPDISAVLVCRGTSEDVQVWRFGCDKIR